MRLIIVESPTKAMTIQRYLGKDYRVVASKGHIRDLSFNGEKSLGVDVNNEFAPDYVIDQYKQSTINYLKKLVDSADDVYLATDPDREGEAIAWHLADVLGLDINTTKRLEFHEITRKTGQVDKSLVALRWSCFCPCCFIGLSLWYHFGGTGGKKSIEHVQGHPPIPHRLQY